MISGYLFWLIRSTYWTLKTMSIHGKYLWYLHAEGKRLGLMWQIFYCNSYVLSILVYTFFSVKEIVLPRVLCVACCWMDMNKEEAESWAGGFFLSSQLPRLEWRRQTTLGEVRSSDTDLTLQWSPTIDTPTAGGGIFTRWGDGEVSTPNGVRTETRCFIL